MTLPHMDWDDLDPDDLVETVLMPDQLGTALQDQSETKFATQSADRFPGYVDGTLAGGPLASGPLGMVNKMYGRFVSRVAQADPATIEKPKDLQPLVPGFFNLPLQDLFAPLLNALMGIGGGVLGGALSTIANFFAGRWAQVDDLHDGQMQLNDRVDLLSPLQDYGSSYAGTQNSLWNKGKIPFDKQIGPMKKCHLASGGIVFEEQGMWDVRARVTITSTPPLVGAFIDWEIRVVKDSDGSIFSVSRDTLESSSAQSREINTSVVVPTAGYRAEVWVTNIGPGRQIAGGPERTRLTVQHISRSTSFQIEG
ncbi:hypothetical protein [Gordonia cholesterolivorans]|uniref:Minor tail protein n=1 Tax=Gordonia cholesterolivorans TaxID=559625 RepID=A0ABP5UEU4_9ACTN